MHGTGKKLHSFNEKEFIIRYIIELDTNIVSYLKSFYDIKLKDYEIIKAIDNLRKDLDNKRENFLLGFHLYILENLKKVVTSLSSNKYIIHNKSSSSI